MNKYILLLLLALPVQATDIRDRTPLEIDAFIQKLVEVDKACRVKLAIPDPPFNEEWYLGCGDTDTIFVTSFE